VNGDGKSTQASRAGSRCGLLLIRKARISGVIMSSQRFGEVCWLGVPVIELKSGRGLREHGRICPVGSEPGAGGKDAGQLDFMGDWYPVQVKQMDKVGRPDIDKFQAAMMRTRRKKGFFVGSTSRATRCGRLGGSSSANIFRLWR